AYNLNPQRFLNEVLNAVDDMVDGAFDFWLHFTLYLRLVLFPFYFPFCLMCVFHLRHRSFCLFSSRQAPQITALGTDRSEELAK
ncbi:unnamed protein product, partial [Musa acuminata subsp. burmannicoides]